jgi:hypothetical protein
MKSKGIVQEAEGLVVGGGATGVAKVPGPITKGKAGLPNSHDQGDSSPIRPGSNVVDSGLDQDGTDTENNTKVIGADAAKNAGTLKPLKHIGGRDEGRNYSPTSVRNIDHAGMEGDSRIEKDPIASLSMREDILDLFSGSDLSEEFKDKASTLFEAAVNARVNKEVDRLNEEFESLVEDGLTEAVEDLVGKIDDYIGYVADEWMKENILAVESGLRSEMTESFMTGLRDLFTNHYVDLPEDQVSVVEQLASRVVELEDAINETIEHNIDLNKNLTEMECEFALNNICESLTATQKARVIELAEGISYDSSDEFQKKLNIIKESVIPGSVRGNVEHLTEDEILTGSTYNRNNEDEINPDMQMYAAAISKIVKK